MFSLNGILKKVGSSSDGKRNRIYGDGVKLTQTINIRGQCHFSADQKITSTETECHSASLFFDQNEVDSSLAQ